MEKYLDIYLEHLIILKIMKNNLKEIGGNKR